jgi:hypothetical protein
MSKTTWWDYLPEDVLEGQAPLTEDDFWQAVADANGLDVSEIADGDVIEWM